MFTLQETLWQLSRNRVRTVILLLATALLAGCMAFYLGSIRANQEAFDSLAEATKIQVDVTCGSGAINSGLNITTQSKDSFMQSPYLENFLYGARAVGAYSPEARGKEPEGDTFYDVDFAAINHMDAIYLPDYEIDFADGYNESFLTGEESLPALWGGRSSSPRSAVSWRRFLQRWWAVCWCSRSWCFWLGYPSPAVWAFAAYFCCAPAWGTWLRWHSFCISTR